ncbi:MAG: multidrug DMT transporter permease [Legionella sp.]|nr:multidrug DMT transporter permease [Legionella sp.]
MRFILLLVALFSSSFGFSASITCPENRCVVVVDAGNSGSRLHVYRYELDATNTPFKIKNIFSKKIEPGFASIALKQKSIDQYLSHLFSDVPKLNLPVYFYATSGMRKLNFSRQQAYYAKLTQWFSMQPEWQLVVAKTLKSREEALYGWLAVNYELGTLTSPSAPFVGVVDTGSASLQMAFPVSNTEVIHPDDYMNIDIYGRHISLFAHGFLGLGQDEIKNQYLNNGVCFPKHYPLPDGSAGAGDFQLCKERMKPLVNGIHQVDSTVKAVIESNLEQTWYIIGGISSMLQERPFMFEHNTFTNQALSEQANRQVCQQNWSILGTLYPEDKHLFASCLSASYFYSLFVDGLGINHTQPIHYLPKKISSNDWTLGVILYQKKA